ncbi:hypothetical protein CRG49_004300 [Neisseria sp. N95_16]|uniref:Uncharacterized protein n=1 Tax=Neisseria brasiliensis TaxID=2666100 RepID=A0A5Q3S0L1_9NEIS|nr:MULTISPECIES: hypothetical protein [Neisseria]MRN37270.1 hypothetical protein [Neisseria brasiliensis]PJO10047.1 hypothetical protein CRG49_004300 [Neisseria sp. N95_16]PJO78309.1 hypothetical protein CWC45_05745 [Neisseria sp. N177_16]QGL25730.1 hypothetical protein GJV52_09385 [Neisseria brasiliensis]
MNQQQKETRELLELEIKLARLKVAASYLKQRKLKEIRAQKSAENEAMLYRLADFGSSFATSSTSLLSKTSHLPLPKPYRYGAIFALFALQAWQNHLKQSQNK